jgi:1-acyl-sn-glycerol-3-phosphate acyltransferase
MLCFWALSILMVGPLLVLWAFLSGNVNPLYYISATLGKWGVRLAGVKIERRGLENLRPGQNYIVMANHSSNLDPPILIPSVPGRCSVLVKKEVFRIPILGAGMRLAQLVPVDRGDRDAAIASIHNAVEVLRLGLNMLVYPEGTRSSDGRLLPFKKGPFHLAMESGVPVLPVTLLGTYECWPKTRFALRPGTATVVFHPPLDPHDYVDRDDLEAAVAAAIASALPPERRNQS